MLITKLLLFAAMFFSLKFLLKMALINIFKVEKEFYHKDFVHKKHKIINVILGTILIPIFILLFYFLQKGFISQMSVLGIFLLLAAVPLVIESYFWWKQDPDSRYYVLCIGDAIFFIIFAVIVWQFGIFGLTMI
ncbi:DUF4181 domain-containing protein [Ureibacillus acetophenoni]|uniref:Uncharacterized protein DUF4181 n=1 Tax=Ureibacillus acetophenoni TaxID=614649 RepID=A0A285UPI6_9BACL|nr:DUF4181 domain-containing protein [Ureibacillus acetophenoni]SOC43815.1 uncharacterized protein DUF4181 [Ureibacillus acetophenoni]